MKKLDDTKAIEITDGIWWVGFADNEAGFSNNPYLLVDEDEAVLFDPGPGHPLFRDLILQKIEEVTNPEKIRYIVVHHQDPDLCGLIPFIENILHPDLVIMAHPRTALFVPYYGARTGILPIGDGDSLELRSGRTLTFYHAPYLHFAGNMMTYDPTTASLFSGDIFAVFSRDWSLYADDSYIDLARSFIEHYVASKEPVLYAYDKIKKLKVEKILPQHGGIIKENVEGFLDMLKDVEPGHLLKELNRKPSPQQTDQLLKAGKEWLKHWLKKEVEADSLDELLNMAIQEGPSTVSLLIDDITNKANEFGVSNPLAHGRVHKWDSIWSVQGAQLLNSIRRRFLSRQYGLRHGSGSDTHEVLQQSLLAFKTNVAVMFVDIRGFTKWSSEKSPDDVVNTLDRELELITRIINSNGGRVNKVLGDGLLAYFIEQKIPECLTAAKDIQVAVTEGGLLPVGVGVDFGEVIMGDIGQESRLDYTLIGRVVNSAARMCDSAGKGEIALTRRLVKHLDGDLSEAIGDSFSSKDIMAKIKPGEPEIEGILLSQAS